METLLVSLISIVTGFTEAFKSFLDTLPENLQPNADVRVLIVRLFALLMGVAAALLADFNLIEAYLPNVSLPNNVAVILSGLALFIPADLLHAGITFIKASRDLRQANAASVKSMTPKQSATKAA